MGPWFEVVLILVLILANGLLSMSETAIVSARRARLQQRAEAGEAGAGLALGLTENPNIFLATVQIGITLIGVLTGAFGGATAARSLAGLLERVPFLAGSADQVALILVVCIITYLSLIIGELVPKRVALNSPEAIAARVAAPMTTISRVGSPLVSLLSGSTDAVLRLLRIRQRDEPPVTAEEIGVLLEQGARAGVFAEAEQEMVEAVFDLTSDTVAAHMMPRTNVVWFDVDASPMTVQGLMLASPHSRFPVCRRDLDQVLGVVNAKDIVVRALAGEALDLENAARPAMFVPESMTLLQLLEQFRRMREHMAIVIDEFGGVAGIVTLQDVLEAIVGDIPSEETAENPAIVRRADGSLLLDGAIPYAEAAELLGLDERAGVAGGFHTLAGYVLSELGHIPDAGEQFTAPGWRLEVVDMDGHRVDKVIAMAINDSMLAAPPAS